MADISGVYDKERKELESITSQYKFPSPGQTNEGCPSPRMTSRQVDSVVGDLEYSSTATKVGLFNFLLSEDGPQPYVSSTTGSSDAQLAIRRASERLQELQKTGSDAGHVRQQAARKLQASLPTYLQTKDTTNLAPLPGIVLERVPLAQAAGAKAAEIFLDHGSLLKLKLLGFSLAGEWKNEIGDLKEIYEEAKKPFAAAPVLGYAFKEAFNEILINQFPENQKQYFNEWQSSTDYEERKAAILLGIHAFIEDPKTEMEGCIPMPHSGSVSDSANARS